MLQMKKPLLGHLVYSWVFLSTGPDSGSRDYRGSAPLYSSLVVCPRVPPLEGLFQRADKKCTSQSGGRVGGKDLVQGALGKECWRLIIKGRVVGAKVVCQAK